MRRRHKEVDKVSAEGRGRYSITMNASGSLSILLDTTTGKTLAVPRKDENEMDAKRKAFEEQDSPQGR